MKKKILSLLFLFFSVNAFAFSNSEIGTKGAAFLKLGSGAKAIGMANAFTAVPDGSSDMIYWNPAGLASMIKKEVSFMYSSYFEDISYEWASFALPTVHGVFGLAFQHLSYGSLPGIDENRNIMADFSPYDISVYLSFSKFFIFDNESVLDYGINLKYIYSKIENDAWAIAFDGGLIYTLKDQLTSIGFALQNLGTDLQYDQKKEALPLNFKLGVSRILFKNLMLNLDIIIPTDNDIFAAFGGQYKANINEDADIFFRAGYDGRQKDVPGFSGFNAGFGAQYKDLTFDYAFSPFGDLGSAHRVSLSLRFGKELTDEDFEKAEASKKDRPGFFERLFKPIPEQQKRSDRSDTKQDNKSLEQHDTKESEMSVALQEKYEYYIDEDILQAQERREKIRNNDLDTVAIIGFVSKYISERERNAYYEMFRNALYETEKYKINDKLEVDNIYSENTIPDKIKINEIMQKLDANELIICEIIKQQGGQLTFKFIVYNENLQYSTYSVISRDSFVDARKQLSEFAKSLAN